MKATLMLPFSVIVMFFLVFFGALAGASAPDDPVPVEVGGVGLSSLTQSPVVLLYADAEKRVLPIFIGTAEADSIRRYLDGVRTPRPMTHDLIGSVMDVLDGRLELVRVSDFRDGTYFALMVVRIGDRVVSIDARPSDAIAVALKQGTPIVVDRKVLEALGYLHDGQEFVPPVDPPAGEKVPPAEWI